MPPLRADGRRGSPASPDRMRCAARPRVWGARWRFPKPVPGGTMIERAPYEAPRKRLTPTKLLLPLAAVLIALLFVAQWATGAGRGTGPLAAAFRDPGAAALAMALPGQEPQQPAPQQPADSQAPSPLAQLDRRLADPAAPLVTETMIREREARAAASAFPVRRTLELSSTMYC